MVSIERMMRARTAIGGMFSPRQLPDLIEYLASDKGEIHYRLQGNILTDQSGTQKRRVKCIISGWFEIADATTMQTVPFLLDIASNLVLVSSEAALPPLEAESDDEDYIVCGAEFDVLARIQEEILLALPASTPGAVAQNSGTLKSSKSSKVLPGLSKASKPSATPGSADRQQESPFAKLAALKKSG